jgi:HEAT repeat protein
MKKAVPAVLLGLLFFAPLLEAVPVSRQDTAAEVSRLLAGYPAQSGREKEALSAELLKLGPGAVRELCRRLLPAGRGDDAAVRFALNGLAVYVGPAGREKERKGFLDAVMDGLRASKEKEVRAFLISQVELAGGREAVRPLARYLADPDLADPAARALTTIGGPEAGRELLRALGRAGASSLPAIIKALGELRSKAAVPRLIPFAASAEPAVREAALYALANIGDPAARQVLSAAKIAAPAHERNRAPSLYLLFARRLAEAGRAGEAVGMARDILEFYASGPECAAATAALELLLELQPKEAAVKEVLRALERDRPTLRAAALEFSLRFEDADILPLLIEKARSGPAEVRAEVARHIGRKKPAAAVPFIKTALADADERVRLAALEAVPGAWQDGFLPDLLAFLGTDRSEAELAALKSAFLSFPAERVSSELASAFEKCPPASKVMVLDVLGEKAAREAAELVFRSAADQDPAVRAAACRALVKTAGEDDLERLAGLLTAASESEETVSLQEALVRATGKDRAPDERAARLLGLLERAQPAGRAALLRLLPRVGGELGLGRVLAETRSPDPQTRTAAYFALSRWPDEAAAPVLLKSALEAASRRDLLVLLEGYGRLAVESRQPAWRKLELFKQALDAVKSEADKAVLLRALGRMREPGAFRLLASYLPSAELRPAAVSALLSIASEQAPEERWLSGHEAVSILRRVEAGATDPEEKKRLEELIEERLREGGFTPLWNGRDLSGWKGLVADPPRRAAMSPAELAKAQAEADERMRAHWRVENGALFFDGGGESLCTAKDYGDFELLVDWKIEKGGDSGIYLRGSPQVQIWDADANPVGSGGLYNNQKGPSRPLARADRPVGEWNSFRIIMIGDRVTVYLNDVMVVDNTALENYWERDKPIYPIGQIELQAHGNPLWFRNIWVREIPRDPDRPPELDELEKADGFQPLFDGRDLEGWTGAREGCAVEAGRLVVLPEAKSGNLFTEREFSDFVLRFEFKLHPAANNGVGIRAPLEGDIAYTGMEVQVLEDGSPLYWDLKPYQYHGSVYGVIPARRGTLRPPGEWNSEEITVQGRRVRVTVNGVTVVDGDLDEASAGGAMDGREHPGLGRASGNIGFLGHGSRVEFRNIRLKELR